MVLSLWKTAAVGGLAVLLVTACAGGDTDGPATAATSSSATSSVSSGPRVIGPDEFAAAVAQSDTVTINVHVPYEGDIAGTDLSIPFDQIDSQASQLPAARSTALAVYCRTGRMSSLAGVTLAGMGYTNIVELAGGMQAWESSGRALVGR